MANEAILASISVFTRAVCALDVVSMETLCSVRQSKGSRPWHRDLCASNPVGVVSVVQQDSLAMARGVRTKDQSRRVIDVISRHVCLYL